MARRYEAIVAGVGTMGAATCWALARQGVRVLGLEQGAIPHALGSAGGYSRMIRLGYYEHPDYVPLLKRAHELWGELETESGARIFHRTGGLYMGSAEGAFIRGARESAERYALPYELLDRTKLARQYPVFSVPDDYVGFYEPLAGMLLAETAISAAAEQALRHGAELHGHEPVRSWQAHADDGGVTVRTDHGTYHADRLVLAGGAWSEQLLGELAGEGALELGLKVTRQVMGWTWPRGPERFALWHFPCWAVENADGSLHYGFPMVPENVGLKVAHHFQGEATDPQQIEREPRAADAEDFLAALRRFLPDGAGPVLAMRVCMYTCTRDSHFVIDRHPRYRQVSLAMGFSGHGFKFMPAIGEVMAELAMTGETTLPVDFLGAGRLG